MSFKSELAACRRTADEMRERAINRAANIIRTLDHLSGVTS